MDSRKTKILIEKYWSCETTLDEEKELREIFKGGDIPEGFEESEILFQYFDQEKKKQIDSTLSDRELMDLVSASAEPNDEENETSKKDSGHFLPWAGVLTKIAAVMVLGFSIVFYIYRDQLKQDTIAILEKDTYEDTQKAYEETIKALNLISKHLNAGKEQTMKLAKFSEAEKLVEESLLN